MVNNQEPYLQYKKVSIETASPATLLLMLFDSAIKFLNQAIEGIDNKDIEKCNNYLQKTQEIIQELMISLDMNIEISHHLFSLYDYFYRRLLEANMKKDRAIVEEVLQFIQELRDTWAKAAVTATNHAKVETSLNIEG